MPRVPVNTVSEVRSSPLPSVRPVQLRGAEGYAAMASSAARGASIIASGIDDTRQRYRSNARAIVARGDAGRALGDAMGSVGNALVHLGEAGMRAAERRDAQTVEEALTAARSAMTDATQGRTQPDGTYVPGTYEAPYVPPGREGTQASGAAVSTAKWLTEWSSSPESPAARLTPKQRRMFDKQFGLLAETAIRHAERVDDQNRVRHLEVADQAATAESLRRVDSLASSPNPTSWVDAVSQEAASYALRKHRSGLVDQSEMDPRDARWKTPEDEALAGALRREFVSASAKNRAALLLSSAANATTDAEADILIGHATALTEWQPDGQPALSPQDVQDVKEAADKAREERSRRAASKLAADMREAAEAYLDLVLGRTTDPARWNAVAARLPPERRKEIEELGDRALAAQERAAFDQLMTEAAYDPDKAKLLAVMPMTMRSPKAKAYAKSILEKGRKTTEDAKAKALREYAESAMDIAVEAGVLFDGENNPVQATDSAIFQAMLKWHEEGYVSSKAFAAAREKLAAKSDDAASAAAPLVLETLQSKIGADLSKTFQFTGDGAFGVKTTGIGEKKRPVAADDSTAGRIRFGEKADRKASLSVALTRKVLNATLDYIRTEGVTDQKKIAEFIDLQLLPSSSKEALDWNADRIAEATSRAWSTFDSIRRNRANQARKSILDAAEANAQ